MLYIMLYIHLTNWGWDKMATILTEDIFIFFFFEWKLLCFDSNFIVVCESK